MMGNNTMRAEGKPEYAMYAMMIPSVTNLLLDYILIYHFDMGMLGAAWATTLSYGVCATYIIFFFISGKSGNFSFNTSISFSFNSLSVK